jgi:CDP-6-deoxy-D-xylo-4-hexulose-3-dehydrase
MKYFDYTIHDRLKNSDYIDAHGLFIGNHHYSIATAIDALTSL